MIDEHFGISPVEMQRRGLIVVAHKSGGPALDIITEEPEKQRSGFLAVSAEDFATTIFDVLQHYDSTGSLDSRLSSIRNNGMASALRFSDSAFVEAFQMAFMRF